MIGIVVSRADAASEHIGEHLRELADWETHTDESRLDADGGGTVYRTDGFELREFEELHLYLDDVAGAFADPDLVVFASRHSGETGPLLTAHHTGNFGPAEHGGEDRTLARACPNAHSEVLEALAEYAPDGYDVGMECTHHGPSSVGAPSMYVEVGSAEPQWDDPEAARAVARAILNLRGVTPDRDPERVGSGGGEQNGESGGEGGPVRHLVGLGGGHYAPRFGRIVRETDWAVGHVAADWCLDAMGDPREHRAVLAAAFAESDAQHAVLDGDHPTLSALVADLGYRVVGETWVRAVRGVALSLVERLEDDICPVAEGLRFGDRARNDPPTSWTVCALPAELVAAADGIDREATHEAVAGETLAFETTENGNRIAGRAAVASRGDYERLVESIISVIRTDFDEIDRDGDTVIARKQAFDPGRARELGVPEGPAFGRLANGQAVDVNGETITPDEVRSTRTEEFPVGFNPSFREQI